MSGYSERAKEERNKKLLNAISSLKRVIGASDGPEPDYVSETGRAHIYMTDTNSTVIMEALFHQFIHGNKPVWVFDKKGKPNPLPQNFAFKHGDPGPDMFEIELHIPDNIKLLFVRRANSYVQKLIAPTKCVSRER